MEKKDNVSLYIKTKNNNYRIIRIKIKRGDMHCLKKNIDFFLRKNNFFYF